MIMAENITPQAEATVDSKQTPAFGPVGYPTGHAFPGGETADNVVKLVAQIGAGWAKYGLTLGRLALTQSARTLESTSEILGTLAKQVETVAEKTAAKIDAKVESVETKRPS